MKRLYADYCRRFIQICFIYLFVSFPLFVLGQGFIVKEFKMMPFDVAASTHMRMDSLKIPCGLVKVLIEDPQVKFTGNVVGSIENKTNEYWVYLSKGTKSFTIKRNQYLPMIVNFNDYGIDEIESNVVYQLRLKEVSVKAKNSIVINVKPKTALLTIDGIEIERSPEGSYCFLLEKGEHVCRVSGKSFRSKTEVVNIGKEPQHLDVELESLMATVKIECKTTDAHLYVNDKEIGVGSWEGNLPAGDYIIAARKAGHSPQNLDISLLEKEERTISFPELKRDVFPVYIKSTPSDCFNRKVKLDGKTIGSDSVSVAHISAGNHFIEIEITGCNKISDTINIESTDTLVFGLHAKTVEYLKAYQDDITACLKMACKTYGDESFYWGDKTCKLLYNSDKTKVKKVWENNVNEWKSLIDRYKSFQERNHKIYTLLERFADCDVDAGFLGESYYMMKDFEKALSWKLKSLKDPYYAIPELADRYFTTAICYKELGNYNKAIEFANKAEKVYGGYIPPKEFLAECYLKLGNKGMAVEWYRKALKCYIDGSYFGKNEFLEKMKELGLYDAVVKGIL